VLVTSHSAAAVGSWGSPDVTAMSIDQG